MIGSVKITREKVTRDSSGKPRKKTSVISKGRRSIKIVKLTCITKDIRTALMGTAQYITANFGTGGRPSRILTTVSYILAKNDRLALIEALNTTECRGYTLSNRMLRFLLTREYVIAIKFDAKKRIVKVFKAGELVFSEPVTEDYVRITISQYKAVKIGDLKASISPTLPNILPTK